MRFTLTNRIQRHPTLKRRSICWGISRQSQAECKLELGHLAFHRQRVGFRPAVCAGGWDFKNDPLGQEAKFRSARLDYFRAISSGHQSQLDVLKSATSQLIANDALALSFADQRQHRPRFHDALNLYARRLAGIPQ